MSDPQSLAMIKMEKNFRAVIEKGYPRKPWAEFSPYSLDPMEVGGTLFGFILRESEELGDALDLLMRIAENKLSLESLRLIADHGALPFKDVTTYREALVIQAQAARKEAADVSNCVDYLFEGINQLEAAA